MLHYSELHTRSFSPFHFILLCFCLCLSCATNAAHLNRTNCVKWAPFSNYWGVTQRLCCQHHQLLWTWESPLWSMHFLTFRSPSQQLAKVDCSKVECSPKQGSVPASQEPIDKWSLNPDLCPSHLPLFNFHHSRLHFCSALLTNRCRFIFCQSIVADG